MTEPLIVPRSEHTLSRREIDPDALKVLYRLHNAGYTAYLVGGSVRDLLLERRPKDFDIGTSAHPYQVKRLFRNCYIIGRRFRLAHVKFGPKIIEVATFRRGVPAGTEAEPPVVVDADHDGTNVFSAERPVHRDNTFGTPEEDAFRRDFTVNALFYDIASFSIIDYVGGLEDLRLRRLRSIGDPNDRFLEDPVRMLRAVVLGTRLDLEIDGAILEAIEHHGAEITNAAPARLLEEYYKILRSGASAPTFAALGKSGLLTHVTPEIPQGLTPSLERALISLDTYRLKFGAPPPTLTNAILLGTLLVPMGLMTRRPQRRHDEDERAPATSLGMLALPRRDVERLGQVLGVQRRLLDVDASPRSQTSFMSRPVFAEALTWLALHGGRPDLVDYWTQKVSDAIEAPADGEARFVPDTRPRRRRRRRRPAGTGR